VLREHGVSLVDLELRRGTRRSLLRIYIDKPGGVGIEDCRRVSDEAGDVLDAHGLLPESYDLEVSSPGLDRELRKDREWRWAVGKPVRIWTREAVAGRRELVGRLLAVEDECLVLAGTPDPYRVPRGVVAKGRLVVERPGVA
jgi:ribosome maturation factor RimP